jgi:hypothetical protein
LLVCLLGNFGFSFSAGQFGDIFIGLFDELLDSGTYGIVVEKFVVPFLDALVDIWEVGAET